MQHVMVTDVIVMGNDKLTALTLLKLLDLSYAFDTIDRIIMIDSLATLAQAF